MSIKKHYTDKIEKKKYLTKIQQNYYNQKYKKLLITTEHKL